jgi:hypothetical protein
VGIIVLGVLIALAAEQVVESLRWQQAARDFRAAVDHEAALNIGAFEFNQLQQKCTRRRLDELQTVLERSRDGQPVHLAGPIGMPLEITEQSSVWESKDVQVIGHLPLDVRLKYAELYDQFRTASGVEDAQFAVWKKLAAFEEPGPLSLADRRQLHGLILDARGLDSAMAGNWPVTRDLGKGLGIKPALPPEIADIGSHIPQFELCHPILKS